MRERDRTGEFGAIYLPALQRIRDLWMELEPLIVEARYDDLVAPTTLHLEVDDGIGAADAARFDVQWSDRDCYSFHYADSAGVNWRFDRHPNPHSPERHFHPPSETTAAAEPSCIQVEEVSLVTRVVHSMWRLAYDSDDLTRLNNASNPP